MIMKEEIVYEVKDLKCIEILKDKINLRFPKKKNL